MASQDETASSNNTTTATTATTATTTSTTTNTRKQNGVNRKRPRTDEVGTETGTHETDNDSQSDTETPAERQLQQQQNPITSSFVASMTFASASATRTGTGMRPNCDCDECGPARQPRSSGSMIPETIRLAIQEHHRQSRRTIRRTQHRALVKRATASVSTSYGHGDTAVATVAVWEWTLPAGAEPILEFGNNAVDRFIWVKRLSKHCILQTIGTGIVGSAHEEQTRETLDWQEGHVFWVPSNNGKAVGWICQQLKQTNNNKNEVTGHAGPAVLFIAKVPLSLLVTAATESEPKQNASLAQQTEEDVSPRWMRDITQLYNQVIVQPKESDNATSNTFDSTRLRSDMADRFKQIVTSLLPSTD